MLEIDGICKAYSGHCVLEDVRFVLPAGQCLGIVGENGSGKSTLLRILKYLNTNFQEKITLATLGEKFFLSEVTLCNYFKKYLGVTFLEYLSHLRITKAKELLLTTKKSMEEIAVAVGLGSANYFGLFFKKAVGLSPMQFRKL